MPLCGNAYKVSVTDSPFCVIWHEKHSADWLAALASPYPASPDFSTGKRVTRFSGRFASLRIVFPCHPYAGGRIGRSMLSCRDMAPWLSIHSPTTEWGQGGGASHQRGNLPRPPGRLYGFPTGESPVLKVLYKTGAFYNLKAPPPPFEPYEPFEPGRRKAPEPSSSKGA